MMKKHLFIILASVFLFGAAAQGQENVVSHEPTGDSKLDRSLNDLNDGVKDNVREFARKLSRYYHIPEETADWLLDTIGMSPGDAYMAAKAARAANRTVEDVAEAYKRNKGKGWGAIAKELGIKPGSEAFHQLKADDTGFLDTVEGKGKKQKNKKTKGKAKGAKSK